MDWKSARGRLNALRRHRAPDDPALADAERDLRVVRLEDHVRRVVDAAPPLTAEQADRLRRLLPVSSTVDDGVDGGGV